jgi:hypothetical protein
MRLLVASATTPSGGLPYYLLLRMLAKVGRYGVRYEVWRFAMRKVPYPLQDLPLIACRKVLVECFRFRWTVAGVGPSLKHQRRN